MRKIEVFELEDGTYCDETYLMREFINSMERRKEFELFKQALVKSSRTIDA